MADGGEEGMVGDGEEWVAEGGEEGVTGEGEEGVAGGGAEIVVGGCQRSSGVGGQRQSGGHVNAIEQMVKGLWGWAEGKWYFGKRNWGWEVERLIKEVGKLKAKYLFVQMKSNYGVILLHMSIPKIIGSG